MKNKWLRKLAVVIIAILTFGIYTPTYLITDDESNEVVSTKSNDGENETISSSFVEDDTGLKLQLESEQEDYTSMITEQAKDYTIAKLGPRIVEKVDDDVQSIILPGIEDAIQTVLSTVDDSKRINYTITELPSQGYGEKIFNIFDNETQTEVARFHVRRDNRPQEGYWFNFHYHLIDDQFETHYTIGEIYWDKNTPPKWMA